MLTASLDEWKIALRQAKRKVDEQVVCNSTVTVVCDVFQGDASKFKAVKECPKQQNKEPKEKSDSAYLKKTVRSLAKIFYPYLPLCSAFPSEYVNASRHGCQEKSVNFALNEILWAKISKPG